MVIYPHLCLVSCYIIATHYQLSKFSFVSRETITIRSFVLCFT